MIKLVELQKEIMSRLNKISALTCKNCKIKNGCDKSYKTHCDVQTLINEIAEMIE
jgi:hypothetical protein